MDQVQHFDCAVIGLGLAGAAALNALARRGIKVVGLEQYDRLNTLGSSHGSTRLVRVAYFEGAEFVPMARHALDLWRDLETRTGQSLFRPTGVIYGGRAQSAFMTSMHQAAAAHSVALDAGIPQPPRFSFPDDFEWALDHEAGYLHAEPALSALLDEAQQAGATIRTRCPCTALTPNAEGVLVTTRDGALQARHVIVTTGAWVDQLLPSLKSVTHIERQVLHWFKDPTGAFRHEAGFRPFAIQTNEGNLFYGFPTDADGLVKVAEHLSGTRIAGLEALDRTLSPEDTAYVTGFVRAHMPELGDYDHGTVCMYPMARDDIFILDRHPTEPHITLGVGLSGHGFKFGPAIGEALANLALGTEQHPTFPTQFFSTARFVDVDLSS